MHTNEDNSDGGDDDVNKSNTVDFVNEVQGKLQSFGFKIGIVDIGSQHAIRRAFKRQGMLFCW